MFSQALPDIDAGDIYNKLSEEDNISLESLVQELLADCDEGFSGSNPGSHPSLASDDLANPCPMDPDVVDIIDSILNANKSSDESVRDAEQRVFVDQTTETVKVPITSGVREAQEKMTMLQMDLKEEKVYTELQPSKIRPKEECKPPSYNEGLRLLSYPKFNTPGPFERSERPIMEYKKTVTRITYPQTTHIRSNSDIDQLGGWRQSDDSIHIGPIRPTKSNKVSPNNTPYTSTQSSRSHSPNIINKVPVQVAGPSRPVKKIKKETKERIHKCPHQTKDGQPCQQAFFRPDELKRHVKIHTGEKPYKCQYCIRAFARSDHLKTHTRTHTGEKPYDCKYCDKRFARSDERLRHHQVHEKKIKKEQTKQEALPYVSQAMPGYPMGAMVRARSQGNMQVNTQMAFPNAASFPNFGRHSPPAYHQVQNIQGQHQFRVSRPISPMNSYPPTPPVYLTDSSSTGSLHHCARCNYANCQCTIKRE